MRIIKDKDPIWYTDEYDIILLGTHIYSSLSNGFQGKMKMKYPYIDEVNTKTPYGDRRKLGTILPIRPKNKTTPVIVLMYISTYPRRDMVSLDYAALERGLRYTLPLCKERKVMTTVLGSSVYDGNGDKSHIMEIMGKLLMNIDVDIYDYTQVSKKDEIKVCLNKMRALKDTDPSKYEEIWSKRWDIMRDKLYLNVT